MYDVRRMYVFRLSIDVRIAAALLLWLFLAAASRYLHVYRLTGIAMVVQVAVVVLPPPRH